MVREAIKGLDAYEATPEQNVAFRKGFEHGCRDISHHNHDGGQHDNPYHVSDDLWAHWMEGFIFALDALDKERVA